MEKYEKPVKLWGWDFSQVKVVEEIEGKFKTDKGIRTNSERFLIVGSKGVGVSVS